jgi:hypothetical protein
MDDKLTLRQLVDGLPDDDLSSDIRAKVSEVEKNFMSLAQKYKDLQTDCQHLKREADKAKAAKDAMHKEKEAMRREAEERLGALKANVEAIKKAKTQASGYTIVFLWRGKLTVRVMHDQTEAAAFIEALGDKTPLVACKATTWSMNMVDPSAIDDFLESRRGELIAQMDALGIEQEIVIPDEVEDTLRETRLFLTRSLQNVDQPPPKMLQLIERLNAMLIDEDEPKGLYGPSTEGKMASVAAKHPLDELADIEAVAAEAEMSFLEECEIAEDERRKLQGEG